MSSNQVKASVERIGVRGLIAFAIIATLAYFYMRHGNGAVPLSAEAEGWKTAIESLGAEPAYKDFSEKISAFDAGTRHSYAHSFGAGLYAVQGASGFPVCRDLFEYGCAHGFIVRALQVEGEGAVGRLADACRKQPYPGMCLHGIGHGLVSYFGYDDSSFHRSIAICRDVVHDVSTAGCVGGATMEYGLKSMSFGALTVAPITEETKYAPCTDIVDDAKSACYFWLTGWWYSSQTTHEGASPRDAVKKMGTFCRQMPEQEFTGECFAGIGDNVSMAAEYDAKRAAEFCAASTPDAAERVYCKAYAENILLGDARTRDDAPYLCASEEKEAERSRCDYLARMGVAVFDKR
jgi:hypothetical protein